MPLNVVTVSIFRRAQVGHHRVLVDPAAQASFETWRAQLGCDLAGEIDLIVRQSAAKESRKPSHRTLAIVGEHVAEDWSGEPRIRPETAERLMIEPLSVLVEDRDSDVAFLKAVVTDAYSAEWTSLLDSRSASFIHGGGSGLKSALEARLTEPVSRFRTFVVFDSDGLRPGTVSPTARELSETCVNAQIPYCCLARREIENYLPLQAIARWAERKKRRKRRRVLAEFKKLSREQRDHFDMKKGLAGPNCARLYEEVDNRVSRRLRAGFGAKVWKEFLGGIDDSWLVGDGSIGEIDQLFDSLLRGA